MKRRSDAGRVVIAANQNIKERQYWLTTLAGEPIKSRFPYDCSPGGMAESENRQMAEEDFRLSPDIYRDIIKLSGGIDLKLHMILEAGLVALLEKYTGSRDIITGSPILKQEKDAEFINTILVFRTPLIPVTTFKELLLRVKETIVNATRHQNFPLEVLSDLVDFAGAGEGDGGPLFDVALLLSNIHDKTYLEGIDYRMLFSFQRTADSIEGILEYDSRLYRRQTVRQIIFHYSRLLEQALQQVDTPLSDIDILSPDERHRLLLEFNSKRMEFPCDKTFTGLFQDEVEKSPLSPAVIKDPETLTYIELNEKANRLARLLRQKGACADTLVAVTAERSADMIVAVIAVMKSGGAYLPVDPDYPAGRIAFMLKDSGTRLLLAHEHLLEKIQFSGDILTLEGGLPKMPVPLDKPDPLDCLNLEPINGPANLVYVIYTSGSTGKPKGVMVQHDHFVNIALGWQKEYCLREMEVCLLQMASFSFDVFAGDLARAFLNGGKMIINPVLRADAESLYGLINKHRVTLLESTPAYIIPFMKYVYDNNLEIDSLRLLILGSDSCPVRDYKELAARFAEQMRIVNSYGVTEATIDSSYYEEYNLDAIPTVGSAPIGKPLPNVMFYILDEMGKPTPPGVPGELYIGGDSVTRGYLDRPELTAERFRNQKTGINKSFGKSRNPFSKGFLAAGGILYRTGDLARWGHDGNMEFLGRGDYQVKIRGYRIELGEIESKLLEHEQIKEALVIEKTDINQEKYLCGYYVADIPLDATELRQYLGVKLPEYMVPWFFVQLEQFPLTPNGKIDRKGLPDPETTGEIEYIAPRDEFERALAGIWNQVLGIKDQEPPGIDHRFFDLGGNSLKAIIMISQIQKVFNVKLTLADIFNIQTIRGVAEKIKDSARVNFTAIEKAEKKSYYPLSSAQKRLYVLQQMDTGSTVYNIPIILLLNGKLETGKLEQVFKKLLQRHESFRTSFTVIADEPVQRIYEEVEFEIDYTDYKDKIQHFIRPFDLSRAPLLRVGLLEVGAEERILMVDMHHIISDGTSTALLAGEFMELYSGGELPSLRIQYKDYAQWQTGDINKEALKKQEGWWLKEFSGEIPQLHLPLDYPRPAVQGFAGSHVVFGVGAGELAALKRLALELGTNATLYMVILSIYSILLAKLSGQEEVIIGAPVAGRTHADLEPIIGMFINTLTFRTYPAGHKTFKGFLKEIKEKTVAAFENQEYPFEKMVENVKVNRDLGRNPLFDAAFILQNVEGSAVEIPGLSLKPYPYDRKIAKFDLLLQVFETGTGAGGKKLAGVLEYCTQLFKPETIERFIGYFQEILTAVIKDPGKQIAGLEMIPEAEKKRILEEFNATDAEYPKDKTVHELFIGQVETSPDSIALVGAVSASPVRPVGPVRPVRPVNLTYRQLSEQSNRVAVLLTKKGVLPDDIVGIMMGRSVEMIVVILAILKSGGAYMPIDPDYPQERIDYMLKDSSAKVLLTGNNLESSFLTSYLPNFLTSNSFNLAYIIYTSGSTGKPKGVMVEHRSLVNLCCWHNTFYCVTPWDRATKYAGFSFDASVWEIFPYLVSGASLYIVPEEIILDVRALNCYYEKNGITVSFLPTQVCEQFLALTNRSLRVLLTGGDKLKHYHYTGNNYRLYNNYGPTENTVVTTCFLVTGESANIPIGKPVFNNRIYILDRNHHLQPIGVPGELYVGGESLARGYLNNPELTSEKLKIINYKLKIINGSGALRADIVYSTGDLARWLPAGGVIEFLGRVDHQVKIRGFRIELGEIEGLLLKHGAVKETVVIDRQDGGDGDGDGEKYLCAYVVPRPGMLLEAPALKNYLSRHLPDYMVPTHFITMEKIPLTSNGKVDKQALPAPLVRRAGLEAATYEPPRDYIERALIEAWSDVLNINNITIGIDDNFFDLGGHSLNAAALTARMQKAFNVAVPLQVFFQRGCIREIAKYIKGAGAANEELTAVEAVEEKEYYPLSPAQKRLYILQQIDKDSTAYNIPRVISLGEGEGREPDIDLLEKVFKKLIRRHDSLRTSFITVNDEIVQRVDNDVVFEIDKSFAELFQKRLFAFDLSKAPLLRVGLLKDRGGRSILMVDMHHIISDGISHVTLEKEFLGLRDGKELAPVKLQYKDYVHWQHERKQRLKLKQQEIYWLAEFAREVPALDLPIDYPRPLERSFEGNTVLFGLSTGETQLLKKIARESESTLFIVTLWVFLILLYRLTGQEEMVIGVPVSGRQHPDLDGIIGVFINSLPIRLTVSGNQPALALVESVKQVWLKAFENQDYPFEELVSKVSQNRDIGRNPLFDVMLNFIHRYENAGGATGPESVSHDPGEHYVHRKGTAKFDLSVDVLTYPENVFFSFEYSTQLFKPETIEKFLDCFRRIFVCVLNNPGIKLDEIESDPGYTVSKSNIFDDALGDF